MVAADRLGRTVVLTGSTDGAVKTGILWRGVMGVDLDTAAAVASMVRQVAAASCRRRILLSSGRALLGHGSLGRITQSDDREGVMVVRATVDGLQEESRVVANNKWMTSLITI